MRFVDVNNNLDDSNVTHRDCGVTSELPSGRRLRQYTRSEETSIYYFGSGRVPRRPVRGPAVSDIRGTYLAPTTSPRYAVCVSTFAMFHGRARKRETTVNR